MWVWLRLCGVGVGVALSLTTFPPTLYRSSQKYPNLCMWGVVSVGVVVLRCGFERLSCQRSAEHSWSKLLFVCGCVVVVVWVWVWVSQFCGVVSNDIPANVLLHTHRVPGCKALAGKLSGTYGRTTFPPTLYSTRIEASPPLYTRVYGLCCVGVGLGVVVSQCGS